MTTAWIFGSVSHSSRRGSSALIMSSVSELSAAGRLSVMSARRPRRSNRTSSVSSIAVISRTPSLAEQPPRDDHAHDLVRSLENLVHAHVAQVAFDRIVLEIAVAAVKLKRIVAHREGNIGGKALR